jgi:hypothetical protein
MSAKGMSAVTELKLLDQNTLWFVIYGKTKRALECLEVINKDEIEFLGHKNRLDVNRKIVDLQTTASNDSDESQDSQAS